MSDKITREPAIRFDGFTDAWEQRKLGELGKVYTGNTPPTSDIDNWTDDKTGHVWITPTDINQLVMNDSKRHLSDQGWSKARTVPAISVLITSIASIGKNAINTVPVAFNQQINAIVPENNDPYFILSAMVRDTARFASLAGQTATAIINKTTFEKFKIAVPSFDEQKKIGEFFSYIDHLITRHQRKCDLLIQAKQSYLQKMFPKNGADVPEIRFQGFTDAWKQRKLGELTNIKTGSSDLQDADENAEYPFFVRSENVERSRRYIFDGEAILIPGEGKLGDIYHYINGKFDFHQRVYKISGFSDTKTDGKYIFYYMQNNFKRHAMKFTVKATVDSLRLSTLTDFQVILPEIAEQIKIGSFFANLDLLIILNQHELNLLKNMKKSLLQQMFA